MLNAILSTHAIYASYQTLDKPRSAREIIQMKQQMTVPVCGRVAQPQALVSVKNI
jgi:hypothetical protein